MSDSQFRLQAKKYLLTWPQCGDLTIEEVVQRVRSLGDVQYLCVCRENHHDSDGEHLHCFVLYRVALEKRGNQFTIDNHVCNVRVVGNKKEDIRRTIEYVKKDGNFIWEGMEPDMEKKFAKKEKLQYAIDHPITDCIESGNYSISEICKIPLLKSLAMKDRPRNKIRKVFWFWGETGTGKTKLAEELMYEKYEENYWMSSGDISHFKNGYSGEKGVIIDDLRNGDIKFNDLLRLLDRYKYTANIKGSTIPWMADDIIITSPYHPMEAFKKWNKKNESWEPREDIEQLLRRIYLIKEFPDTDDTQIIL